MRWLLLLAGSSLACGAEAQAEPTESAWGPFVCEAPDLDTLAKSLSPDGTVDKSPALLNLEIGGLAALPGRTTPDAVCVRLQWDLDRLLVQTRITGPAFSSGCQLSELYRIGPTTQPLAFGDILRFPLDYAEVLAPGLYTHEIKVWWNARNDKGEPQMMSNSAPFEVDAAGLRPLTVFEYDAALTSGCDPSSLACLSRKHPYVPPAPDPCPIPRRYTDVTSSEVAISRVDVDTWQNVTTRQALRWRRTLVDEHGTSIPPRLEFSAHDANGAALRWEISVPTDEPAAFEATGGQLLLTDPYMGRRRAPDWSSSSMSVAVSLDGTHRLLVQLSDIVLEPSGVLTEEPRVTRTLSSASIVGEWMQL